MKSSLVSIFALSSNIQVKGFKWFQVVEFVVVLTWLKIIILDMYIYKTMLVHRCVSHPCLSNISEYLIAMNTIW